MKLLLDMYKGVGKEMRDKTQLMAAERKARLEVDELKQQLKKIQASFMLFHPPPNSITKLYSFMSEEVLRAILRRLLSGWKLSHVVFRTVS